ncbi:MAG: Hsp20/alpha crystallin family protein [Opitutaceae bacterium]|jgi:HSP20 family protein|nr:Hsp20/alpha crystallin family protein [Opitutaceae bacterium]
MRLVRYNYPAYRTYSPSPTASRNPWCGLDGEIDRLFSSALGGVTQAFGTAFPVDLYEDKDNAYVRADLPGVSRDAIEVDMVDQTLTIKATRKRGEGEGAETTTFSRAVSVPENVQASTVSAAYENGVLTVTLPKKEEAKPRKISVQVG